MDNIEEAGKKLFDETGKRGLRDSAFTQNGFKLPPAGMSEIAKRTGGVSASIGGRSTHMTVKDHRLSRAASSQ